MRPLRALFVVVLVLVGAGCGTLDRAPQASPSYTRAAAHYRAFEDADALAAYLRYGSAAGPLLSAHRGGPVPGFPENALATFDRSLRHAPALIETDVRLSADSVLVLLHDDMLDRTTTGRGPLAAHAFADLRKLLLRDNEGIITPFRMPTLAEALAWAEGRAVLTLDVKRGVPPRHVVAAVRRLGAEDRAVIIVYTLADLLAYHRLAPDLLLSASIQSDADLDALLATDVDHSRLIAFTGVGEVKPALLDRLHALGLRAILGTFGLIDERARQAGPEVYEALFARGVDVIATDDLVRAARALPANMPAPIAH